jgi:hypothetical protein
VGRFYGLDWFVDVDCEGAGPMMDVRMDGRDVCVRLRDDVWQMEEPGTLCLTRDQAYFLRAHLNALGHSYFDEPEDG